MSAPTDHQVRNKEICEGQDNGDFDQAWNHRCRPGIFNFYIQRINTNRGAFRFTFGCSRRFHEMEGVQVMHLMLLPAS